MSNTVDSKVLEMRFDNKQFESGISESMSSLEKFRQNLNLTGATKGLADVGDAAEKVSSPLSGLSGAVETVQAKFSALQVMGITALTNITNQAINAGKRIVSALTIEPIKMGFSEYETQIGAVQTIMSNTRSKGTTLTDVNAALDELNTYADKTIYNFTEMTRNIGTFTAAGVDLDTSVQAIKGIANLAAVSGSTSQQASTAMYQLSQALSSGTVKLQDWNSVVNAGMGGQVFQDALKETAKVHGVNVDAMIKKEGSFRETLKSGWITSEILTETLAKFTGDLDEAQLKKMGYTDKQIKDIIALGEDANNAATKVKTLTQLWDTLKEAAQSGWGQTWRILVGDFEEAKALFTEVSDTLGAMIGKSADSRNELLKAWKELGGRTDIIDSIKNTFNAILNIINPITSAFREIFPPITAQQLKSFSEGLLKLTERFKEITKEGSAFSDNLKRTFKGVFAVFSILKTVLSAAFKLITPLFGGVGKLGGGFLNVTANIGDAIVAFDNFLKSSNILGKVVDKINSAVTFVVDKLKSFISIVKSKFGVPGFETVRAFFDRIAERMGIAKDAAGEVKQGVTTAVETVDQKVKSSKLLDILSKIGNALKTFGSAVASAFSQLGTGLSEKLGNANFDKLFDFINTLSLGGIAVAITKFVKGFNEASEGFTSLTDLLDNVVGILDSVKGSLEAWQQTLKAKTLLTIASAIGILAASILIISFIDSKKLAASLGAITGLFTELMASLAVFSKISGKMTDTKQAVGAMLGVSVAVLILAVALKKIADLGLGQMLVGLLGIAGLCGIIVATSKLLSKNKGNLIKGAAGLIPFAAGILILSEALKRIGAMDMESLKRGLIGIGVIFAELVAFIKLLGKSGNITTTAAGILILSGAMVILSYAVQQLGSMTWGEIGKGLAALAGCLILLVGAIRLMPKNLVMIGSSVLAISAAMVILSYALKQFATMTWDEIGRGLAVLAGSLISMAIAMRLMPSKMLLVSAVSMIAITGALLILNAALQSMASMTWGEIGKGLTVLAASLTMIVVAMNFMLTALPGAAALLVVAGALAIFTPILMALGSMTWGEIGKGLLTLAGVFAVLGISALVLTPVIPLIIALGAAIALLGVGMLGVGAGLLAMSTGLLLLSTVSAAGATAIVASLTIIITGIVGLIPVVIQKIGEGLIVLCEVIIAAAPKIGEAILAIILAVIQLLTEAIPPLIECLGVLLDTLLKFIVEYVPKIVVAALELICGFLDGIAQGLPDVIQSAINLVISFINGMADGIRNNTDKMIEAINNLMDAVIGAIKKWFSNAVSRGKELISSLIDGVKAKKEELKNKAKELVQEAIDKIKEKLSDFKSAGKDVIDGFINGIKDKIAAVGDAASEIGKKALNSIKDFLGINSPAKEFIEVGKYSDEGIIVGLKKYAGKVANAAQDVGGTALDSMRSSISHIADVINSDMDTQPTIRPILDLSEISSGAGAINRMLDMNPSLGVMSNVRSISAMMNRNQNGSNDDVVSAIKDLKDSLGNSSGDQYNINGITYDDGSNVTSAVKSLVRAVKIERRT